MSEQSSYRQIMKATSLFGGVQIFNIILSVVRSKFVAVLLGPSGMGIMGLLLSTTNLISRLTNFGLGTSAVKDIAAASGSGNSNRIDTVVTVVRRMVWITGILGLVITLILSSWLSQLTFGNHNYTIAFIWLSISLLLNQLSSGQLVILQGLRKLHYLAKANLLGSVSGLLFTLPLYYIWGIDGIVPAIMGTAIFSLILSWYYSRKVSINKVKITTTQTLAEGKNMLQIGLMISLSGFFSVAAAHIVRIFISRIGGVDQVGFYNAGFAILYTYVGLIFSAMATDYYPRLSAVADDNIICHKTINQQSEIAILILAPIIIVFLVFINWVIVLLYSKQFLSVRDMMYWASLGMFFKASSWAIAFLFLAKGDSKIYFWTELSSNTVKLIFNILGFYLGGLSGLGISFLISYFLYLVQVFLVSKIKFQYSFSNSFKKIFLIQFGLALLCLLSVKFLNDLNRLIMGIFLIGLSLLFSITEIEKRLGLFSLLKKYKSI
jgi:O-antigen/teichoic acid export membrane protein